VSRPRQPILVVKVGGNIGGTTGAVADLPALLAGEAVPAYGVVIVHGGGPAVSHWMERLALPVSFKDGLRVTDGAALEVATMVLRGLVSTALVGELATLGIKAVGLCGADGGLLEAAPHPDSALGFVGQAGAVCPAVLQALIERDMVPLVAPLAYDAAGQLRNVNGDTVCGAIAGALQADLTVFLTDVPGVLDEAGAVIPRLDAEEVERRIAEGSIRGGMVPKVHACLAALRHGARAVCIADGRARGTLAALAARQVGHGTIIAERGT
jgi:acetylglutamate kinase